METPNILFITVDSLRADHLSCYGYDRETAPYLSSLAEDGVVCREAIANAPNTPSSFPSILTSTHPQMYGGYDYLTEDRPFLAEELQKAGYETLGFHSNPHLGSNHNYDNGFDRFEDSAEGSDSVATLKDRVERRLDDDSLIYKFLRRVWHYFTLSTDTSAYARAGTISNKAIDWIEGERSSPFFMWLHYMDVHYPFTPDEESLSALGIDPLSKRRVANLNARMQERPEELTEADVSDLLKLYDGEIRYTDAQIRNVVDALKRDGIYEDTVVIVTADHGEAFGEHGRFGHHPDLYDELLRVPLILNGPGISPGTVDQQVSLIDVGPTIYDLVGTETPSVVQGESFYPLLDGESQEESIALITAARDDRMACRTSEWKFFWRVDEDEFELYDLTDDPAEQTDLSDERPEVVERFVDRLNAYRERVEETNRYAPDVS
jgi:arylsulfatase A-like enzyme